MIEPYRGLYEANFFANLSRIPTEALVFAVVGLVVAILWVIAEILRRR